MALPPDKRKKQRVDFSTVVDVNIVAIDGTWRSSCKLLDISEGGAKLSIDHVGKLPSKEFFLLFSTTGAVYRRCQLSWVNGEQIGVTFLREHKNKN